MGAFDLSIRAFTALSALSLFIALLVGYTLKKETADKQIYQILLAFGWFFQALWATIYFFSKLQGSPASWMLSHEFSYIYLLIMNAGAWGMFYCVCRSGILLLFSLLSAVMLSMAMPWLLSI